MQSELGYIVIDNERTDIEEAEPEPVSMAELNARSEQMHREVQASAEGILEVHDANDAQTEAVRRGFEDWDDFGAAEADSR